ncbi:YciI family protein [Nonomuraea basaltis]|uniref:YciI family protein n=1 Tax=Nonomuraea basaltis TaxID=2495887 RepID=UPI00110C6A5E|nr:YciI family protein [Nonomuraea basaltis]TMR94777.1 YciI family protein [Nonomuraea basaltis]
MRYLLMIYTNEHTWGHPAFLYTPEAQAMPEEGREELSAQFGALMQELVDSGELVGGEALADPVTTKTVRVRGGAPVATDGPYVEAKEHLAGYFVIDCENAERAMEIASRFPDARFAGVEVRPMMSSSGEEM